MLSLGGIFTEEIDRNSDPRACNVYRDLEFPQDVYQDIEEFYEEAAPAGHDKLAH